MKVGCTNKKLPVSVALLVSVPLAPAVPVAAVLAFLVRPARAAVAMVHLLVTGVALLQGVTYIIY